MQAVRRQTQKALARAIPRPCKTSASARTPSFIRNLGMVETTSVAAAAPPVQRVKSSTLRQFPKTSLPDNCFQSQAGALISPWFYLLSTPSYCEVAVWSAAALLPLFSSISTTPYFAKPNRQCPTPFPAGTRRALKQILCTIAQSLGLCFYTLTKQWLGDFGGACSLFSHFFTQDWIPPFGNRGWNNY